MGSCEVALLMLRSEIQGQTRQHSKLINLLEVEQICICVNKQEKCDEISNEMKKRG